MTDTQDAIAAFLAKGGKVAKVAEGATCGLTDRDFYKLARDPVVKRVVDPTEQRIDLGHAVVNGLGEVIYIGE